MKGDFARMTFNPAAHFSRVLLQQGRVLLEADFNEQSAITNHFLRCLVTDIVGRRWAAGSGFAVEDLTTQIDFVIRAGRYYVDGLVCENDSDCSYRTQPLWPNPESATEVTAKPLCVYLDCWERHVSCVEEPRLREIALGGAGHIDAHSNRLAGSIANPGHRKSDDRPFGGRTQGAS
ncbi:DUF6519 domain-containing protein [Ensifer canadensis]